MAEKINEGKITKGTWAKRVAKSLAMAAKDTMQITIMPNSINSVTNTVSAVKDFVSWVKDSGSADERGKETVKNTWNKAINDIKTGNFYTTESADEMDLGGIVDDNFGDFDFGDNSGSDDDFDFDISDDDNDKAGEYAYVSAKVNAEVTQESTKATMRAIRSSTDVIANTQLRAARISAAETVKPLVGGMSKLYEGILGVNSRLETINSNIEKIITHSNETSSNNMKVLELMSRQTEMMAYFADHFNAKPRNYNMKDKPDWWSSGLDIKQWFETKTSGIKEMIESFTSLASTLDSLGEDDEVKEKKPKTFNVMNNLTTKFIEHLIPKKSREALQRFDEALPSMIRRSMNRLATSENGILSFIGEMIGLEPERVKLSSLGRYTKTAVAWDGKSKKALEVVIPEYLSNIEKGIRQLNGEKNAPKTVYDYDRGAFVSLDSLQGDVKKMIADTITSSLFSAKFAITENTPNVDLQLYSDEINKRIKEMSFGNTAMQEAARKKLSKTLRTMGMSPSQYAKVMGEIDNSIFSLYDDINSLSQRLTESAESGNMAVYQNLFNRQNMGRNYNLDKQILDSPFNIFEQYDFMGDIRLSEEEKKKKKKQEKIKSYAKTIKSYLPSFEEDSDTYFETKYGKMDKFFLSKLERGTNAINKFLLGYTGDEDFLADDEEDDNGSGNPISAKVPIHKKKRKNKSIRAKIARKVTVRPKTDKSTATTDTVVVSGDTPTDAIIDGLTQTVAAIKDNGNAAKEELAAISSGIAEKGKEYIDKAKDKVLGKKDEETGEYKEGLASGVANKVTKAKDEVKKTFKESVKESAKSLWSSMLDHIGIKRKDKKKEKEEAKEIAEEVAEVVNEGVADAVSNMVEDNASAINSNTETPKETDSEISSMNEFKTKVKSWYKGFDKKKIMKSAVIGGAVGLLGTLGSRGIFGLVTPGGPIAGAILGLGASIVASNERFMEMMFGEKDDEGKRTGGVFSRSFQEKFKKAILPTAIGAGGIAIVKKLLGFGGLSIGGATGLFGAAITAAIGSIIWRSEAFQDTVFGPRDKDGLRPNKGKTVWGKIKDFVVKNQGKLAGGVIGGATGIAGITTISKMGSLGGLAGGPFGLMAGSVVGAALGIASNADAFKNYLYGDEALDEEGNPLLDKNGKPLRRKNGLFARMGNFIRINAIEPMSLYLRKQTAAIAGWFENKIKSPVVEVVDMIKQDFKKKWFNFKDTFLDKLDDAKMGIKHFAEPIVGHVKETITSIFKPIANGIKRGINLTGKITGAIISTPFKLLNVLTFGKKAKAERAFLRYYFGEKFADLMNTLGLKPLAQIPEKLGEFREWVKDKISTGLKNLGKDILGVVKGGVSTIVKTMTFVPKLLYRGIFGKKDETGVRRGGLIGGINYLKKKITGKSSKTLEDIQNADTGRLRKIFSLKDWNEKRYQFTQDPRSAKYLSGFNTPKNTDEYRAMKKAYRSSEEKMNGMSFEDYYMMQTGKSREELYDYSALTNFGVFGYKDMAKFKNYKSSYDEFKETDTTGMSMKDWYNDIAIPGRYKQYVNSLSDPSKAMPFEQWKKVNGIKSFFSDKKMREANFASSEQLLTLKKKWGKMDNYTEDADLTDKEYQRRLKALRRTGGVNMNLINSKEDLMRYIYHTEDFLSEKNAAERNKEKYGTANPTEVTHAKLDETVESVNTGNSILSKIHDTITSYFNGDYKKKKPDSITDMPADEAIAVITEAQTEAQDEANKKSEARAEKITRERESKAEAQELGKEAKDKDFAEMSILEKLKEKFNIGGNKSVEDGEKSKNPILSGLASIFSFVKQAALPLMALLFLGKNGLIEWIPKIISKVFSVVKNILPDIGGMIGGTLIGLTKINKDTSSEVRADLFTREVVDEDGNVVLDEDGNAETYKTGLSSAVTRRILTGRRGTNVANSVKALIDPKAASEAIAKETMFTTKTSKASKGVLGFIQKKSAKKAAKKAATNAAKETAEVAAKETAEAAAKKVAKTTAKVATEEVFESATNPGFIAKVMKTIKAGWNGVKSKLTKIAGKLSKKHAGKIVETVIENTDEIVEKGLKKNAGKIGTSISKKAAKTGILASGKFVPLLNIVLIANDAISGFGNPAKLFNVHKDEVDLTMRIISSIMKTVLGLAPMLDIVIEVLTAVTGEDYKCDIATILYKAIVTLLGKEDKAEALSEHQKAFEAELAQYNEEHGTDLTAAEYSDKVNKGFWAKTWDYAKKGWKSIANFFTGKGKGSSSSKNNASLTKVGNGRAYHGKSSGQMSYSSIASAKNPFAEECAAYNKEHGTHYSVPEYANMQMNGGMALKWKASQNVSKASWKDVKNQFVGSGENDNPTIDFSQYTGMRLAHRSQVDPLYAGYPLGRDKTGASTSIADSGCGPTAMSIVASNLLGKNIDPTAVAYLAQSNGWIVDGGSGENLFTKGASSYGLKYKSLSSMSAIKAALKNGNPVIIAGKSTGGRGEDSGSPYTNTGHIMAISGYNGDKFLVNDPLYGTPRLYTEKELTNGMTHAWSYSISDNKSKSLGSGLGASVDPSEANKYGYGTKYTSTLGNTALSQGDSRWKDTKMGKSTSETFGSWGCLATSVAMALSDAIGRFVSPVDLMNNGFLNANSGGYSMNSQQNTDKYKSLYGVTPSYSTDRSTITNWIQSGKHVALFGNYGPYGKSAFTYKGGNTNSSMTHAIYAFGETDNGRVVMYDPGSARRINNKETVTYDSIFNYLKGAQMFPDKGDKTTTTDTNTTGSLDPNSQKKHGNMALGTSSSKVVENAMSTNPDIAYETWSEAFQKLAKIGEHAFGAFLSGEEYTPVDFSETETTESGGGPSRRYDRSYKKKHTVPTYEAGHNMSPDAGGGSDDSNITSRLDTMITLMKKQNKLTEDGNKQIKSTNNNAPVNNKSDNSSKQTVINTSKDDKTPSHNRRLHDLVAMKK